jgi:hypothetical protein
MNLSSHWKKRVCRHTALWLCVWRTGKCSQRITSLESAALVFYLKLARLKWGTKLYGICTGNKERNKIPSRGTDLLAPCVFNEVLCSVGWKDTYEWMRSDEEVVNASFRALCQKLRGRLKNIMEIWESGQPVRGPRFESGISRILTTEPRRLLKLGAGDRPARCV